MANSKKLKCGKCHKLININNKKSILCDGDCDSWYHFCCSGLSEKEISEYCKNCDKIWFCNICKIKRDRRRSRHSLPPQRISLSESEPENSDEDSIYNSPTFNNNNHLNIESNHDIDNENESNITISDVYKLLKTFKLEFLEFKKNESIKFNKLSEKLDEVKRDNCELMRENSELKNRINEIEINMNLQNQFLVKNNIEISGVEEVENENLVEIVKNIINIDNNQTLCENDIENVYRKKTQNNKSGYPSVICVCLNKNRIKREIISNKKKITEKINSKRQKNELSVYISESITQYFSYLFKCARDLKRKKKIKYAWFKNGNLFIKEADDKTSVKVLSFSHLAPFNINE